MFPGVSTLAESLKSLWTPVYVQTPVYVDTPHVQIGHDWLTVLSIYSHLLCLSELDRELGANRFEEESIARVIVDAHHAAPNDHPEITCCVDSKPPNDVGPPAITSDGSIDLAASSDDALSLNFLNYVQKSEALRLIRVFDQDWLFRIKVKMQDAWLAESRVVLDRLYILTNPQSLSRSSTSEGIVCALTLDLSDVSGLITPTRAQLSTEVPESALSPFQRRVHDLPPELFRMVTDKMFEEAFGPKRVFPYQDPAVMNNFLALDRRLYQKYSDIYWCQNTWIIGPGPVDKTMRFMTQRPYDARIKEFSLQVPNRLALGIKSVHICLSKEDVPSSTAWHEDTITEKDAPLGLEDRLAIQEYQNEREYFISTALRTWQDKFDRLAVLNLQHLTLDLREAFGPDGEYMGVIAVERFIPFAHGLPPDFRILAPTKALVEQIRNVFYAMNTP